MKSLRILRELLVGACVWFTVLAFCLILIRAIVQGSSGNTGISILHFALLFPCALGFSGARMIRKGAFAEAIRLLLHYLITLFSVFFFLWLPSGNEKSAARNLAVLGMVTLLYWLAYLIIRLTAARFRNLREEDPK